MATTEPRPQTPRPPALAPRFESFPHELTSLDQWVIWQYQWREDKWTKPLFNARTGRLAKSNDASTWSTFLQARAIIDRGGWDGPGFVVDLASRIVAFDFDHCVTADGKLDADVARWVGLLDSYTEYSPSGTGIRVFVYGTLPPGHAAKKGPIEIYTQGRYLTVTGNRLPGTPATVNERAEQVAAFHAEVWPPEPPREHPQQTSRPADQSSADLLETAFKAKNGAEIKALYSGDISGCRGDSEADFKLCQLLAFYAGDDEGLLDSWFRSSGLMREKWDKSSGPTMTYGQRTMRKAMAACKEHYSPRGLDTTHLLGKSSSTRNAAAPKGTTAAAARGEPQRFELTDLGNAERLIHRVGPDLRYSPALGWLAWDGRRFERDESGEASRRLFTTIRSIDADAGALLLQASKIEDEEKRAAAGAAADAMRAWRKKSEAAPRISGALTLAEKLPGVYVPIDHLDTNPWLLNCRNGTLDLQTGAIKPHDHADLITHALSVNYDPSATAPTWDTFLQRVLPDDDVRGYIQRAAGYALTGRVTEQCLFFLYGSGGTGKSTFLKTLLALMAGYGQQAHSELLLEKPVGGVPNDVAKLRGARLVATIEVDEGKRMAESIMKQLTGGDRQAARFMRGEFFEFEPTFKIFLAANHRPVVQQGDDYAIWRRIKVIPFDQKIAEEEKDKDLTDKLTAELPGILAWAVRGCRDWQQNGMQEPEAVRAGTEEYKSASDTIGRFVEECCETGNQSLTVTGGDLYTRYKVWADTNGTRPLNSNKFGEHIGKRSGVEKIKSSGVHYYGIAIKAPKKGTMGALAAGNEEDLGGVGGMGGDFVISGNVSPYVEVISVLPPMPPTPPKKEKEIIDSGENLHIFADFSTADRKQRWSGEERQPPERPVNGTEEENATWREAQMEYIRWLGERDNP